MKLAWQQRKSLETATRSCPATPSNAVDVKSVYRPEGKPDIVGTRTESYQWSFVSPITLAGGVRVQAAKRATHPERVPV